MRPTFFAMAVVLLLAACADESDEAGQPDAADEPDNGTVEPGEAPEEAPEEMGVQSEMLTMEFEGFWRYESATETAVFLDGEADADAVAQDVAGEEGVAGVEPVDEAEVEDRTALEALQGPDEATPQVLLAVGEDREAAVALAALEEEPDVRHAFTPTCEGLAGTARHDGLDDAQALLDDAGCDEPALLGADADAEHPWVAAAQTEDDEVCVATATAEGPMVAGMAMCEDLSQHPSIVSTLGGGLAIGFGPPDVEVVELEFEGETTTAEAVEVGDGRVFAAGLEVSPDSDAGVAAPDIDALDWRFLDADGEVVAEG